MEKYRLYCWILNKSTEALVVDILRNDSVAILKDAIKNKMPKALANIDAPQLMLRKVCALQVVL